jgi:nicotinamide-nucleotide amidase
MTGLKAAVIAIGDEMTSGARLDTNTQWLCQRLAEIGVAVCMTSMVGDDLDDNVYVFKNAAERVDLVVCSGGLGPTADDLTREVLGLLANKPLVLHEPSLRHIETLFATRAREMPPRNVVQAMLPEGATDIFNPRGTAPGIDLTVPRVTGGSCRIFALPGVPAEMKEMFVDVVTHRIQGLMQGDPLLLRTAVVKCFGLGESDMEARLGEMISRQSSPRVGITVSAATISLRIAVAERSEVACSDAIDQVRREIYLKAGEYVFGEGEEYELHHAVAEILEARNETIATLEVGHSAPVANWLADVPQRHVFLGGRVISPEYAARLDLDHHRQELGADWLLVVDPYPDLRTLSDAPAEVKVSIVGPSEGDSAAKTYRLGGHPSIIQSRIGKSALAFLRQQLLARTTTPQTTS